MVFEGRDAFNVCIAFKATYHAYHVIPLRSIKRHGASQVKRGYNTKDNFISYIII